MRMTVVDLRRCRGLSGEEGRKGPGADADGAAHDAQAIRERLRRREIRVGIPRNPRRGKALSLPSEGPSESSKPRRAVLGVAERTGGFPFDRRFVTAFLQAGQKSLPLATSLYDIRHLHPELNFGGGKLFHPHLLNQLRRRRSTQPGSIQGMKSSRNGLHPGKPRHLRRGEPSLGVPHP
jgi:hypothetical protein